MAKEMPVTLSMTRHFDAASDRVFDAWIDPEQAGKFLFKTSTGEMQRVEIDARVGGSFCIVERRDGQDAEHRGEYLEIDRPRHLVFSFGGPGFPSTIVTIEIDVLNQGCELTLTHQGVWAEYEERTKKGWTMILDTLDKVLKGEIK